MKLNKRIISPDRFFRIKKEARESGKPFMHRSGAWYKIAKSGNWNRLKCIGNDLFDKRGNLVGYVIEPKPSQKKPVPNYRSQMSYWSHFYARPLI